MTVALSVSQHLSSGLCTALFARFCRPGFARPRSLAKARRGVAALACLLFSVAPQVEAAVRDGLLDQYLWKSRVLIAFAPDANDPALARQRRVLADAAAGAGERDLVLVEVAGDAARAIPGGDAPAGVDAAALRRRFAAPAGRFKAVLVGKDGGAKLVSAEPIPADRLFTTIDAMPMRRREGAASGQGSPQ